ncbi:hypothetical protein QT21_00180, partial [Staphylococcus aureus]
VVTRQLGCTVAPLAAGEGRERHHLVGGVAHVPLLQVFRAHARIGSALQVDLLDPTTVDEVVHIAGTQGDRQGVVDIGDGHAQGTGAFVVDGQLVLRLIVQAVRTYLGEDLALRGHAQELVARFPQLVVADAGAVLQEHVETGGVTQLQYGRRGAGEHHRVAEAEDVLLGTGCQVGH